MKSLLRAAALLALGFGVGLLGITRSAEARIELGDWEISGEIFNYAEVRPGGSRYGPETFHMAVAPGVFLGPEDLGAPSNADKYNTLNAWRTEVLIELVYRGIPHVTPVLKMRPYWDLMYAIEGKPGRIERDWETNLTSNLNDKWDPLFREAYLDITAHPLFIRAGRQIVTWGRSDGVSVLDVVNPRNFRNPLTFEQERFMIPQWMVNASYDFSDLSWMPGGVSKELQVIWNIEYLPARFPGFREEEEGLHPWTLNVVDFADQVINVSKGLFTGAFFDGDAWDDSPNKSEVFVRWRARTGGGLGPLSDITYSFHYAYLFEDIPFYTLGNRIDAGFAINIAGPRAIGGGIDFDRHRYEMVGVSFDKALTFLPWQFKGSVLRGEFAYNFGNQFYEPDLALREADNLTFLIGLDQYLYLLPRSWMETPWFVSFQYWHDRILRKPREGEFTNLGSVPCDAQPGCGDSGYIIGGATNLFNGLRDQSRNVITLFMFNDFLPGKVLHVELFMLAEFGRQNAQWFRAVVGYNFNNHLSARLGTNQIFGKQDSFFGQFKRQKTIFTEIKFTF
jgi:hypothetical protein